MPDHSSPVYASDNLREPSMTQEQALLALRYLSMPLGLLLWNGTEPEAYRIIPIGTEPDSAA